VLADRDLCSRLERGTADGRLVRDLISARGQGLLVRCNLPDRVPRPEFLRPARARALLPELFEPADGPFFSALRLLETGQGVLIARVRRLLARQETLLMGDAHSGNIFVRETEAGSPEVRWIDFQHWGSGAVALELAYFLMGAVDARPGGDAELLRDYHGEFARAGGAALDLQELVADASAATLLLASAALFHYPVHSWPGGSGIISCLVDLNDLAAVPSRVRDSEKHYRMIYRMIQRVPIILNDEGNPLARELRARRARAPRARPVGGARSRL